MSSGENQLAKDAEPILVIRADAGPRTGVGHVMRCLALAHAWQDFGGRAVLAARALPEWIALRLAEDGVERAAIGAEVGSSADAERLINIAHRTAASWVVVDGYEFTEAYVHRVRTRIPHLAIVDDLGRLDRYPADLILNQNLHASEGMYRRRAGAQSRLLIGPRYALIRREFWTWADRVRRHPPVARRLLVSVGGGDQSGVANRVLSAIDKLVPEIREVALLGGLPMTAAPAKARNHNRAADPVERMAAAHVAVSAAGSTVWELAVMRLPAVLLVLEDNQVPVARSLVNAGAAAASFTKRDLSVEAVAVAVARLARDQTRRRALASTARNLVDGQGGRRIAQLMLDEPLRLREATPADRRQLWLWANDPQVRQASISMKRISWSTHCRWFRERLDSPASRIFVALNAGDVPIGQVRFDRTEPGVAEVDVSVDSEHRTRGLGSRLIEIASNRILREWPGLTLKAHVKVSNVASLHSFDRAGFMRVGTKERENVRLIEWRRT